MRAVHAFLLFLASVFLFFLFVSPILAQTKSVEEQSLNPTGDPWASATTFNPDIPVFWYSAYAQQQGGLQWGRHEPIAESYQFLAKQFSLVELEQAVLSTHLDSPANGFVNWGNYRLVSDHLRALNPTQIVFGYYAASYWKLFYPAYYQMNESWFLHRTDTPSVRVATTFGVAIGDITNPGYQDFFAQTIASELNRHGWDGFLDDISGFVHPPCDGCTAQSVPSFVSPAVASGWKQGNIALFRKIKERIGAQKFHIFNGCFLGNYTDGGDMSYVLALLAQADGCMVEDMFHSMFNTGTKQEQDQMLTKIRQITSFAVANNKYVLFGANVPFLYQTVGDSVRDRQMSRYALGFYLQIAELQTRKQLLYVNVPVSPWPHFNSWYFSRDWQVRIGKPTGASVEVSPMVFKRPFEHGEVWWNNSQASYHVILSQQRKTLDGQTVSVFDLGSKQGMIFSTPYQEPNTVKGNLDHEVQPGCTLIGWACDAHVYSSKLQVDFYEGTQLFGGIFADKPDEAGVQAACGNQTNHRFTYQLPAAIRNDNHVHQVTAKARQIDINGQYLGYLRDLAGSPFSVNCQSTPTPTRMPSLTPTPPSLAGDINEDCTVNVLDYGILFEQFGRNPLTDTRADLNHDGVVNILDYSMLFENYGRSCAP